MSQYHTVVWLNHQEARAFHFSVEEVEKAVIHPDHPAQKLHRKADGARP